MGANWFLKARPSGWVGGCPLKPWSGTDLSTMHLAISSTSQSAIWMYLSKAFDDQRPNNLIAVFDTFPRNNAVPPPLCSECDPKLRGSFPNRVLPSSKVLSRALLEQAPSVRSPMPYIGVRVSRHAWLTVEWSQWLRASSSTGQLVGLALQQNRRRSDGTS